MTLRTVHLEKGLATVRAGATLLYDSDPVAEERETRIKASAFLEATLGHKALENQQNFLPKTTGNGKKVRSEDHTSELQSQ